MLVVVMRIKEVKVYKSPIKRSNDKHLVTLGGYIISFNLTITQGRRFHHTHFAEVKPEAHRLYKAINGRAGI